MKRHLSAAALAALLTSLSPAFAEAPTPTLSLTAEGKVHVAPDTAVVSVGVVTQGDAAGDALTQNTAAMTKLLVELKGAGIADKDIGTTNFSIDPVTVYPPSRDDGSQDPPKVVGYRVSNQVMVTIRDIAKAGDVLDKVVRIGANNVGGISFKVENSDALLDKARAEAMKAVTARAQIYAKAGGFKVGRILSVSESGGAMPFQDFPSMPMMKMDVAAAPVPIAPGERELSVSVSVSWEIVEGK